MTEQEYKYIRKQLILAYPFWIKERTEEECYGFCETTFNFLTRDNVSIYIWTLEVEIDAISFNRRWVWRITR